MTKKKIAFFSSSLNITRSTLQDYGEKTALLKIFTGWKRDDTWMIDISSRPTSSFERVVPYASLVCALSTSGGVLCKLHRAHFVLEHPYARHANIRQHETPNLPQKQHLSIMTSAGATYSASVVESVTHFCVLENQTTQAPPHITNPPETGLLSAVTLA